MAVPGIVGGITVAEGVAAARALRYRRHQRRETRALIAEALELLGFESDEMTYRRGCLLSDLEPKGRHPDDEAALCALAGSAARRGPNAEYALAPAGSSRSLDDSFVLIGSPEAEAIARLAYGYRAKPDGTGMALGPNPPIRLAYRWEEDAENITSESGRIVAGRGLVRRRNWPIVDTSGNAEHLRIPTVDHDGLMATDWLVVTRTPNYLTTTAYELGRSLISVAGAHGAGTRAIKLLLNDEAALVEVASALRSHDSAFQILIEVTKVDHHPKRGSTPQDIRIHGVRPLELADRDWRAATAAVQADLDRWRIEVTDNWRSGADAAAA
jgi:hypothetical protein